MSIPDRLSLLKNQTPPPVVTGIDFISVNAITQKSLEVHFYISPSILPTRLQDTLLPSDTDTLKKIKIYSPTGSAPDVPVISINWVDDVLMINTQSPGDFTFYKLKIDSPQIDPYYNDITFSFKANCDNKLDCASEDQECPPEEQVEVSINYLARDFWSFRRSLLEFASLRYPDWPDRLEADAGVMLVEVMSALGDEMAYYQDRISREAYLETATQRRSIRRHGRLVDYQLHDGLGANVWIDVTVKSGEGGNIPAGTDVWATNDNGFKVDFEIGRGLRDAVKKIQYNVNSVRNALTPHIWDEDQLCLPIGSTSLHVVGPIRNIFQFNDQIEGLPGQIAGRWFLLKTNAVSPGQPIRTHMVRVINMTELHDPILNNMVITLLNWEENQALPFDMDLSILEIRGNLLPATSGRTYTTYFFIGADLVDFTPEEQQALYYANNSQDVSRAIERGGPDGSVVYLFTLPESESIPLVWLGPSIDQAAPEIVLQEMEFDSDNYKWVASNTWEWKRSLLGLNSSQSEDPHFSLDDGDWSRVVGYQRPGEEFIHKDYAQNGGATIRFGDGEFGRIPSAKTVFRVDYRLGEGRRSNVSANTLKYLSPIPPLPFISSCTNPINAFGGLDAETPDEIRQLAPEAFRAVTFRAVRPEDYAEAAERLPWVQRAGATFRWTGSWLSAFVTPDPRGISILNQDRRLDLNHQMDRFRQAGREVNVMSPVYADIDMEIEICIIPDAYPGEVKARVLEELTGVKGLMGRPGYFSADNFTFGTPLNRSALEAVIQSANGVNAVKNIRYRRGGWFDWRSLDLIPYNPGDNVIIRIENDPLRPERGTVRIKL